MESNGRNGGDEDEREVEEKMYCKVFTSLDHASEQCVYILVVNFYRKFPPNSKCF